jgi:hypothetical protein
LRLLAVLLAVASAAASLTGCSGVAVGKLFCVVVADQPHRSSGTAGMITAKVRIRCDKPGPDRITLTVGVEQQNSGWSPVANQEFTMFGAQTTRTRKEPYRVRQVSIPCRSGTFRTTAHATGSFQGDHATYNAHSAPRSNPCGKPT